MSAVGDPCTAGFFCKEGSSYTIPPTETFGSMCAKGEFCPEGSGTATACTAGKYCENSLLSAVSGDCASGFFCLEGSTSAKPTEVLEGAICPVGTYCDGGLSAAVNCPVGTYSVSTGLKADTECYDCIEGFYCDVAGLSSLAAKKCPVGYYCPRGTSNPNANECEAGYMCPEGSHEQIKCEAGTY